MRNSDKKIDGAGEDTSAFSVSEAFSRADPPKFALSIWPNRSLPKHGFRKVLYFTAIMLCIPLLPLLGTAAGLALIPFLLATVFLLWFFIRWNYRDGRLQEDLKLWDDLITVERREPNGAVARWHANPFWVRTTLYDTGRIENYLTLTGGGREIELGAFLSPEERLALRDDLDRALSRLN